MNYIKKFFGHLNTINRHRWEVFKLCCKVSIPFRGLIHDLSKYSPTEFFESVKYYSDGKFSPITSCKKDIGYSKAWLHHRGRNKHHFEYWYDNQTYDKTPIMPFNYTLEMICDRIAASKTYNKGHYNDNMSYEYLEREKNIIMINPKLLLYLEDVFKKLGKYGEKKVLNKEYLKKLYLKYTE